MKRILTIMLCALVLFGLAACNKKEPAASVSPSASSSAPAPTAPSASPSNTTEQTSTSLEAIMEEVLKDVETPQVGNIEITDENFKAYFFVDEPVGAKAIVSEAMIGSIAHSVGLVRVAEGSDAAALAKEIEKNLNPRKWICVEAEKSIVLQKGDLVLYVMSFEDTAKQIAANFEKIAA